CGLVVRPVKGLGSRWRFGTGGVGSSVGGHVAGSLSHVPWSMRHSHTRAISTNWEKKRCETMTQPPPTSGEMRGLDIIGVYQSWLSSARRLWAAVDDNLRGDYASRTQPPCPYQTYPPWLGARHL